ncbi:MAG TPA: hypothetical protein PKK48_00420 [Phycisphaerae bacterium]|nr:hypothetical protein [Phycisphaerae bacterium]HPS52958.1 hypothetical protein [Phycisphaerae bacterium]
MDHFTLEKIDFPAIRRLLAEFCNCSLGRELAMRMCPAARIELVRQWLDETSQMVEILRDSGVVPFGGVTDIRPSLDRAQPGRGATADDFSNIAATLEAALNIKNFLSAQPESFFRIHSLAANIGDFSTQTKLIRHVIGPDGAVRDDASPRLAQLRNQISSAAMRIHEIIENYLHNADVRRLLQSPTITLHGDRYVLPVKAENRGRLSGVVHRASHTGQTVFIEPVESVELNNTLVDLHEHERQEIERLFSELAIRLVARAAEIERTVRTLAKIDLISAKAQYTYQYEMTRPEIGADSLEFFQARHPLIEAADVKHRKLFPDQPTKPVVPIDIRLGSDFDVLLITGSNTGGKTVSLKTVALLVAMAQSGLHIPAAPGAKMPIFEDVLIDIGDEQSLEQSLSTFGAHIERMKYILHRLNRLGRQCLVLLDELGSGTDPDEGGAIGQAVIDELRRKNCMAVITTHLSILKAYALNHDRVENASVEFDTVSLQPTYKLRIGTPGESHAITVAQKLGLPGRIIHDAKRHFAGSGRQLRKALRMTGEARLQAEEARAKATQAAIDAKSQIDEYESHLEDIKKLRADMAEWMAGLSEMQPGEMLHVPSLNRAGRLVRMELHRQRALVDVDNMQVEVPLLDLMPDLGQQGIRLQLQQHRRQMRELLAQAQAMRTEAEDFREESRKELNRRRRHVQEFDRWVELIAGVKTGDDVPISRKPGHGRVVKIDFAAAKAIVELPDKSQAELPLRDIFPQSGPYAPDKKKGRTTAAASENDEPVPHGRAVGKKAANTRDRILQTNAGEKVFVVPFNTTATLVRVDPTRDKAVVLKGAFEIEVAITDIEPAAIKTLSPQTDKANQQ